MSRRPSEHPTHQSNDGSLALALASASRLVHSTSPDGSPPPPPSLYVASISAYQAMSGERSTLIASDPSESNAAESDMASQIDDIDYDASLYGQTMNADEIPDKLNKWLSYLAQNFTRGKSYHLYQEKLKAIWKALVNDEQLIFDKEIPLFLLAPFFHFFTRETQINAWMSEWTKTYLGQSYCSDLFSELKYEQIKRKHLPLLANSHTDHHRKAEWQAKVFKDAVQLMRDDIATSLIRNNPKLASKESLLLAIQFGRGNLVRRLSAYAQACRKGAKQTLDPIIDEEVITAALNVPRPEILQQICTYAPPSLLNSFRTELGHSLVVQAIINNDYDLLQILIQHCRDETALEQDKLGVNFGQVGFTQTKEKSPLHWAAEKNNADMVRLLLDPKNSRGINKKARANVQDEKDNTPLHLACAAKASEAVVQLLVADLLSDKRDSAWSVRNKAGLTVNVAYEQWWKTHASQKAQESAPSSTSDATGATLATAPTTTAPTTTEATNRLALPSTSKDTISHKASLKANTRRVWPWWLAAGILLIVAGLLLTGGIGVLATHGAILALVPFIAQPLFNILIIALSSVAVGLGAVSAFASIACGVRGQIVHRNNAILQGIHQINSVGTTGKPFDVYSSVPTTDTALELEADSDFAFSSWLLCKPCRDETPPAAPSRVPSVGNS